MICTSAVDRAFFFYPNISFFCSFTQDKSSKQATEKEDRFTGTVTWKVYFDYWKAGAGFLKMFLLLIIFLGAQVNLEEIQVALPNSLKKQKNKTKKKQRGNMIFEKCKALKVLGFNVCFM